ncbi:MAG TPA: STAS domain-containing protein [Vicinamibacteria bacterium]|jgi:anti-anti-sigma factor
MQIKVSPEGEPAVVEVSGRIVEGRPADDLEKALRGLIRDKRINTIVDVSKVSWFDSTAIGILISHYVSSTKLGGRVLLLKASDKIKTLMRIVHLYDRFGWSDDVNEARAWFDHSAD